MPAQNDISAKDTALLDTAAERARLAALADFQVLDTEPEAFFDEITKLAALHFDMPIALVSLVDETRQWFKSRVGIDAQETPREISFCRLAIQSPEVMVVEDATQDPRFDGNPLVYQAPDIRFYAGAPLMTSEGHAMGTLCVIDRKPRSMSATQRSMLQLLAQQVVTQMELRKSNIQLTDSYAQLQREHEAQRVVRQKLEASLMLLDNLAGQVPGVIYQYQHNADGTGCFPYASAGIADIYEISPEEAKADAGVVFQRLHPDDLAEVAASITQSATTLQPWHLEYRVCLPRQGVRWRLGAANPQATADGGVLWHGFITDITERKALETALVNKDHFLHKVVDNLPGLVGYWTADLHCAFANAAYSDWFGKTPQSMLNMSMQEALGNTLFERNRLNIEGALAGHHQRFERTITKPSGQEGFVVANYIPDVQNGVVLGFLALVFDISDIKQAQIELRELNLTLEERTRQAESASFAKSSFLANMSHEIRTPMNAILGMLALLRKTQLNGQQHDYVEKTEGAASALLGLLNDILDFSKVEAGKMELDPHPFVLHNLLRDVSVVMAANMGTKENVEVLFDIDAAIPPVLLGDATRLRQILINLGGNAIKFTARGQVVIGMRMLEPTAQTARIEFFVQDSGIGIAPEMQTHIFSGFSQAEAATTRKYGGSGLGLAICKRLVELMGGSLTLHSTLEVGSTFAFEITLGLAQELSAELEAAVQRSNQYRQAAPLRVLVVDDNPIAAALAQGMTTSWGWPTTVARSGEDALALVAQRADGASFPFDAVYIDWQMPGMDGWETVRRMRALCEQAGHVPPKVVMVTANVRHSLAQRTQEEQAMLSGFLVKPVTASMMQEAVLDGGAPSARLQQAKLAGSSLRSLEGLRILVVEDNLINQQVAEELLMHEGAQVILAANGLLGFEAVATTTPPFDAVLMDLQMPVLDGFGATRRIRQELGLQDLPIIAMTANAMASDREACLAAGMNDHIGKPFDLPALVALLLRFAGRPVLAVATPAAAEPQAASLAEEPAVGAIIDVTGALERMGNMRALYRRSLEMFAQSLPGMLQEFQSLLPAQLAEAAARMHTLKGTAATLGAMPLSSLASRLEKLCSGDAPVVPDAATIALLEATVNEALAATAEAMATLDSPAPASAQPPTQPKDGAAVLLAELDTLLAANDMNALACFADGRAVLESLPPAALEALEEAMQMLDFERAQREVRALLQAQGHKVGP